MMQCDGMQTWELHEKHEKEVRQVLKDDKCMDSKGQIRAWHKDTDDKLLAAGHDKLDFKSCKCGRVQLD